MKPMLCFPGDLPDRLVGQALARGQRRTHSRSVTVGPGGFYHNASAVSVAGFADRTALHARAAGVFARNRSAVSHQLTWVRKTRDLTELGYDTDGGDLRKTAQRLPSVNHCAHLGQRIGNLLDVARQASPANTHVSICRRIRGSSRFPLHRRSVGSDTVRPAISFRSFAFSHGAVCGRFSMVHSPCTVDAHNAGPKSVITSMTRWI